MPYFENYGSDFDFFYGNTTVSGNLPGMHIHPHYEALIVINDVMQTSHVNGMKMPTTYSATLTVFAPFTMHRTEFSRDEKSERYVFYFGNTMMNEYSTFFEKHRGLLENISFRIPISQEQINKMLPYLRSGNEAQDNKLFMKLNFLALFEMVLSCSAPDYIIESSQNQSKIGVIIEYMMEHCNEEITAENVAKHFFISRSKLNQDFKTYLDLGFHQLLMEMRLNKAMYLLSESPLTVNKIALELGFKKENYFNTFFKRMTGKTPLQYRKAWRNRRKIKNITAI